MGGGIPLALLLAVMIHPLRAQDRVTFRSTTESRWETVTGTILERTGTRLTIRLPEGTKTIPADRLIEVTTLRGDDHTQGRQALHDRRWKDARQRLTAALAVESRAWMRREILGDRLRAAIADGDRGAAGEDFIALVDSDPHTPAFAVIPLDWELAPPSLPLRDAGRRWVQSGTDAIRLLGASVLLLDAEEHREAARVLEGLAARGDALVFPLARAQLWRVTLATGNVAPGEVARWEDRVLEMPAALRAGPWFLVGTGWGKVGDSERAAAAYLWLTTTHQDILPLRVQATRAAAEHLRRIGRGDDATALDREAGLWEP